MEIGQILFAMQHSDQILDFAFDFIEGKLKLIFFDGLVTLSWPFPIKEDDKIEEEDFIEDD